MWLLGKKDGCAHDSEDDSTDESDLEEGEVEDNSDEEEGVDKGEGQAEKQKPLVSQEVLAKLNHPERLHKFMCYNDKGETNYGPLCKCSRKARRIGVRHALYAGESLIEPCKAESNNIDRLYHYRLSLTPLSNFKVNNPTTISWDSRDYIFDGFSLFTHHKLQQEASFKTILYSSYYQIRLVEEPKPIMFTSRSLNLIADYLFYELFEIADLTWVQEAFKHGCRQLHIMPRFTRPLPDNGLEILAIPHVLKYLLENSHPLIDDDKLEQVAAMEKPVWLEKVVKKYQFTLVTIPGMRPSTIRVDNMDRPVQDSHIVRYPQILHYSRINESLSVPDSKECRTLLKRRKKLHKVLNRRAISRADMQKYLTDLQSVQQKLQQLKAQGAGDGCSTKEPLIELSSQGFFSTGLRADVTQWSLIIPKIVDNVRFVQSLSILQDNMDYKFQNPFYLQLALTHPSYISCASLNQDHIRNTQTNCGLRKPEFGSYPVYKELRVKKKGLKTLLEIMSLKYRQYTGPIYSYERLEYLGDAVLEFLTTVHLYFTFPKLEEGGLATFRTALIRNEHLTQLSKLLGVQHYVLYAHGVDLCSSVQFDHTLANAFEAILGAVFLDGGLEAADKFLSKLLSKSLDFAEFSPCWDKLPPHPLQELYPSGDRKLIEGTPGLKRCTEFEELTGLRFNHISLLARALTHSSSGYTDFAQGNNQTLEFLGDSVLQLVVSDYLYKKYPNHHEGHLTLLRSSLVNNETQAEIFKDIGIAKFIYRKLTTEIQTKERADYVEALLGALFVDQGLLSCKAFCKALFFPRLKVAVYFKDQRIGVGEEKSIQKAQFEAAKNALDTNRSMFPMLLPGTNKLMTNVSSAQVRQLQRKLASRKKDAHALTHMESYWN
ncbi:drosha [Bugula neritina]|uniref:Drosha n=1 Tax=Bugula neritina TaxID=10212 RepID=A0A7J7KG25_BUGNE|nr:drosha [Bugula neritina]